MATASFAQLTGELKTNGRLRAWLWLCVGIAWSYGILHMQEMSAAKAKEYENLLKRSERIRATTGQKAWPDRAEEARAIESALAGRFWREQTQGLAQAAFQDWLAQALQQAAIDKPQLTVVAQQGPPGAGKKEDGTWKVSASVAFDFNPKTFHQFIDKLAGHEKWIVLEALNVRSTPSPRAEMTLVAYFAKAE